MIIESSSFSSAATRPTTTSAEHKVRQVALKIGLEPDSDILERVCLKMRQELVVKVWQLPALDSFQWKSLDAPIGLAAAVRSISCNLDLVPDFEDEEEEKEEKTEDHEPVQKGNTDLEGPDSLKAINSTDTNEDPVAPPSMVSASRAPVGLEDRESEDEAPAAPVRSVDSPVVIKPEANGAASNMEVDTNMMMLEEIGEFGSIVFEDNVEADEAPEPPIRSTDTSNNKNKQNSGGGKPPTIRRVVGPILAASPKPPVRTVDPPEELFSSASIPKVHIIDNSSSPPAPEAPPEAPIRTVDTQENAQHKQPYESSSENGPFEGMDMPSSPMEQVMKYRSGRHPHRESAFLPTVSDHNSNSRSSNEWDDDDDDANDNNSGRQNRRHSAPHHQPSLSSSGLPNSQHKTVQRKGGFRHSAPVVPPTTRTIEVGDDDCTVVASNVTPSHSAEEEETNTRIDEDDCTVVASNVTPEGREKGQVLQKQKEDNMETMRDAAAAEVDNSLYEKWKELHGVIQSLDGQSQRAILGQLMIMANGRSKETRFKMLHQASDSLLDSCRSGGVEPVVQKRAGQMIIYMGQFARLNSKQRKKFGKWVFSAISELYKPKPEGGEATATNVSDNKTSDQEQQQQQGAPAEVGRDPGGTEEEAIGDCE